MIPYRYFILRISFTLTFIYKTIKHPCLNSKHTIVNYYHVGMSQLLRISVPEFGFMSDRVNRLDMSFEWVLAILFEIDNRFEVT